MNFGTYFRGHWLKYITGLRTALGTTLEDTDYVIVIRDDGAAGEQDVKIEISEFKEAVILPPLAHATTHEIGGTDEINIDGGSF